MTHPGSCRGRCHQPWGRPGCLCFRGGSCSFSFGTCQRSTEGSVQAAMRPGAELHAGRFYTRRRRSHQAPRIDLAAPSPAGSPCPLGSRPLGLVSAPWMCPAWSRRGPPAWLLLLLPTLPSRCNATPWERPRLPSPPPTLSCPVRGPRSVFFTGLAMVECTVVSTPSCLPSSPGAGAAPLLGDPTSSTQNSGSHGH